MNPFDIFITRISWGSDGKNRPVLVLLLSSNIISVYPIMTQYENKSEAVRTRYFKINDWVQAGLDRQSYIDTGTLINLPMAVKDNKSPIGKLTLDDKRRLIDFLTT